MSETKTEAPVYSINNPFMASLVEYRCLTAEGSNKETRHFAVDISKSGMSYTCGDSLGIFPRNRDKDVEDILDALEAKGDEPVQLPKLEEPVSFREALSDRLYYLSGLTPKHLKAFREKVTDPLEETRLDDLLNPDSLENTKAYLHERHMIDLLHNFKSAKFSPQEFVGLCKRLVPRLYSIASSPAQYPEEVHLTIASVRYSTLGRERVGVGSTFLADRVPLNQPVLPVFIATSHFGLPEDDKDIIMVGPGTGVAPFRAFLQERRARGARGRNWLFFGEQHEKTDYLYREEFQDFLKDGTLERLDLAWSRDQAQKVYVQDKIREHKDEFWSWLDSGAILYVCGDKERMSRDVEQVLVSIACEHRVVENEPTKIKKWIKELKKSRRYQLDVY